MQRQQKAKTALFVPSNSASPRFTWKRVKGRLIALSDRSDIKTKKTYCSHEAKGRFNTQPPQFAESPG